MAKPTTEQDFLTIILDMMEKKPITAGQAVHMLGHKYGIKISITEEEMISLHEMDLLNSKSYNELVDVKASLSSRQERNLPKFEEWWKDYPSRGVGKSKGVKSTAKTRFMGLSDTQIEDLIYATKLIKTKYIPDQPWFYQLAQVFISNGYEGIVEAESSSKTNTDNRNLDSGGGSFMV